MIEYTDEQHDSLIRGHRKQLADAQATVNSLQAQLEAAERHNTILQDANKVALEKVEALQRERDVWREKATHRGKVAHDLQTQLTEWHTKYITLQAALDAERGDGRMDSETKEFLQEIAKQLEKWAQESLQGGWSTHQRMPQLVLAERIYSFIGRAK